MTTTDCESLTTMAGVARWAAAFLRGDAPAFGTEEWVGLDLDDPRRVKSVVRAALAWWRVGEPLEDVELRARIAEDVESSHRIARSEDWSAIAGRPSYAELVRRRSWPCAGYRGSITPDDARRSWAELDKRQRAADSLREAG